MTRSIHIVIDELVLRGVRPEDASAVSDGLETRLAKLATGLSTSAVEIQSRDEGPHRLDSITLASEVPSALGISVADAVFSSLTGTQGES
jgi:hypothetical protein